MDHRQKAVPCWMSKYGLRYAEFTVPTIKAIQELHQKVKQPESVVEIQERQIVEFQELFTLLGSRSAEMESKSKNKKMQCDEENHFVTLEKD
ncbi:MAG: hypothetical protein AAGA77_18630 [Bacteroidota bacterium]